MAKKTVAYVGLGSNVGDRFAMLNTAWSLVQERVGEIIGSSSLYDTTPVLVEAQGRFLNAVVGVETALGPIETLETLKGIERDMGRVVRERYGPREIDLDLIVHGDTVMDTERLTLPHPRAKERVFVRRPLAEAGFSFDEDLCEDDTPECFRSIFGRWPKGERTLVMGILNVTPDSFSDGGELTSVEAALKRAEAMVRDGADILDVGGESTRPGAVAVDENNECDRVIPLIEALKRSFDVCISIDTRNSRVANEAVDAGASIINDVSAGVYDPQMFDLLRQRPSVAFVPMHSRGTPQTMQSLTHYNDLLPDVLTDLRRTTLDPLNRDFHVAPWRLLLDPGIGFAKTSDQNIELLRHLSDLQIHSSYAGILVGPSRKGFIGHLLQQASADGAPVPTADRDFASAGACCTVVPTVDIVRVHNVRGVRDALTLADAIRRPRRGTSSSSFSSF